MKLPPPLPYAAASRLVAHAAYARIPSLHDINVASILPNDVFLVRIADYHGKCCPIVLT
jgi:hypothetical protein